MRPRWSTTVRTSWTSAASRCPGSEAVSAEEELSRVRPVIERLVEQHPAIPVSIDTRKADVAAALDAGATIVNDVSGGVDPKMFDVVRERRPPSS